MRILIIPLTFQKLAASSCAVRIGYSIVFILLSFNSLASEMLLDEKQEKRARLLFETVRCPSCEGQAIKDSGASMARILRENIRQQVTDGQSDQDIIANLKASYGESIVFMPESNFATLSLWLIPFLILFLTLGKFLLRLIPSRHVKVWLLDTIL